jgi:hypothetical protein
MVVVSALVIRKIRQGVNSHQSCGYLCSAQGCTSALYPPLFPEAFSPVYKLEMVKQIVSVYIPGSDCLVFSHCGRWMIIKEWCATELLSPCQITWNPSQFFSFGLKVAENTENCQVCEMTFPNPSDCSSFYPLKVLGSSTSILLASFHVFAQNWPTT